MCGYGAHDWGRYADEAEYDDPSTRCRGYHRIPPRFRGMVSPCWRSEESPSGQRLHAFHSDQSRDDLSCESFLIKLRISHIDEWSCFTTLGGGPPVTRDLHVISILYGQAGLFVPFSVVAVARPLLPLLRLAHRLELCLD